MNLTDPQIEAIRRSFLRLSGDSQWAGQVFYDHLFDRAPETRTLFVADITQQATKLMSTLGLVVSQLQNWRDLEPVIEDLALRHLAYGVTRDHYDHVGSSLLSMMREVLGDSFSDAEADAWGHAYAALATAMIARAYSDTA